MPDYKGSRGRACIAFISIIGIPWGRACFVIAKFTLAPFGKTVMSRKDLSLKKDIGTGAPGTLGNIVWLVTGGWIMALSHALYGGRLSRCRSGIEPTQRPCGECR
ncbi:YccF domain-containing protein [Caballeronia choica]|uniref:YccF domain-containing protein n=1 Tax=Caballeronia choica TaxID=326476 RepID=UPI000F748B66